MKKYLLLSICFSLALFAMHAQTGSWFEESFGSHTSDEVPYCIELNSDGGYLVTGYSTAGALRDMYLVRIDTHGDTIWERTYGGAGNDHGQSGCQTMDGGFIAVGGTTSFGNGGADVYLVRTDSSGNLLWSKCYGGAQDDGGYSLLLEPDSGFSILGYTKSYNASVMDILLLRLDANGDTLWTSRISSFSWDYGYSFDHTADGGYVIAGGTANVPGTPGMIIKTDSVGMVQWAKTFTSNMFSVYLTVPFAVRQVSNGGYILAGGCYNLSNVNDNLIEVYLIRTDSAGNVLWAESFYNSSWNYTTNSEAYADCIRELDNGDFVLSCQIRTDGSLMYQDWILRIDASGGIIWAKNFGGIFGEERLAAPVQEHDAAPLVTNSAYYNWITKREGKFGEDAIAFTSFTSSFQCLNQELDYYVVRIDMNGNGANCNMIDDSAIVTIRNPVLSPSTMGSTRIPLQYGNALTQVGDPGFAPVVYCSINLSVEENEIGSLKIFPVPASDMLQIEWGKSIDAKIEILNSAGQLLFTEEMSGDVIRVDVGMLPAGIYLLRVNDNRRSWSGKFIRE